MSIISAIAGATGLKDLVFGVLDRIKLSPEAKAEIEQQKAEIEQQAAKMEFELRQKEMDLQAKESEIAGSNIRAEGGSTDKFTSRARPTFMYVIYLVLIWNFLLLPIVQMVRGAAVDPIDLPGDLYMLFGAGYLGYVSWRSLDKSGFQWNRTK